jgi:WXG100 family type VII secretion target
VAIQAEAATIHKAAQDTRAAKEQAAAALRSLYDTVVATSPSWQGMAGTQFQRVMTSWNEQSTKLTNAMEGIATALDESGSQITQTDDAQQQAFNKFNNING